MKKIAEGKTKIVFAFPGGIAPNIVKIKNKPAITALDGEKKDQMTDKPRWVNNVTCNIFEILERFAFPTHYICRADDDSLWAYRCRMKPMEIVIRRVVRGSFPKRNPKVKEGTFLPNLEVEFFLKDDQRHDPIIIISKDGEWNLYRPKEPITPESFIETIDPLLDEGEIQYVGVDLAKNTFLTLEQAWRELNITLEDLKIEVGRRVDTGEIVIADEFSPDIWRMCDTQTGQEISKELYRQGADMGEVEEIYRLTSELSNILLSIA